MKNWVIVNSYGAIMRVMPLVLCLTGCMHAEGKSTVGNTTVSFSGDSGNPEGLVRATGNFGQQMVAAENEKNLVDSGRMPYYRGGCYGNRCYRHYVQNGVAGPLPGGRYDRSGTDEQEPAATSGGDNAAEIEALREEAAQAKRERDEAVDVLTDMVKEAESQKQ